jgi:hypothetical protein
MLRLWVKHMHSHYYPKRKERKKGRQEGRKRERERKKENCYSFVCTSVIKGQTPVIWRLESFCPPCSYMLSISHSENAYIAACPGVGNGCLLVC